jgi:hypothetical protein
MKAEAETVTAARGRRKKRGSTRKEAVARTATGEERRKEIVAAWL